MIQPALPQVSYWDRVAHEKRFSHPLRLDWLERHSNQQARILDYGCGYGRTLAELSQAGFQNLAGVDFSGAMLARARAVALDPSWFAMMDTAYLSKTIASTRCYSLPCSPAFLTVTNSSLFLRKQSACCGRVGCFTSATCWLTTTSAIASGMSVMLKGTNAMECLNYRKASWCDITEKNGLRK